MSERAEVTVHDNPEKSRYEAVDESGVVAGYTEYHPDRASDDGSVLVFPHTVVEDAFEGRGVGSALVRGALDQVREQGKRVRAECQFVKGFIDKHEEYADLLA
jgi:predicted GNAT family acetyltransferase